MSSGTPYIGSKISLVSKAEIRYEGFLYTINQNDSTVTLAKVISLGTEDRVPENPVPAREEVFEYIVFRGSDIKDLHVCEGPKQRKIVEDPAIVHHSTHSYSQNNNPYYPRNYAPFGGGGMPSFGYHPFNFHQNTPGNLSSIRQTPPSLPRTPTPEPPKVSKDDRIIPKNQNQKQTSNFQDGSRKIRSSESRYKDDDNRYARESRDTTSRINRDNTYNRNNNEYNDPRDTKNYSNSNREVRDNRYSRNKDDNRVVSRDNNRVREVKDHVDTRDHVDRRDQRNRENRDSRDDKGSKDNGDKRNRESREKDNTNVSRDYSRGYTNRDNRTDNRSDNRSRYNYVKKQNLEEKEDEKLNTEGGKSQIRGRGGRYAGRGGVSGRGSSSRGGISQTKFTDDFDFETANAKFNKEEIEKELLKVLKEVKIKDDDGERSEIKGITEEKELDERAPLPSPDKFYDMSKSFFDNISCEAMVPKTDNEVMTRRQEQALNVETFGTSASHFRPGYRGRGRGRGRWRGRGRGGFYRGRGSYRGNSNRPWVDYEFDYEAAGIKNRHQPMKVFTGGS